MDGGALLCGAEMDKGEAGYVYLIDGGNGLFKIGVTFLDPEKREKDIQAMCPVKIELLVYFYSDEARRMERRLHLQYRDFHHHGEWFELPQWAQRELITHKDAYAPAVIDKPWPPEAPPPWGNIPSESDIRALRGRR